MIVLNEIPKDDPKYRRGLRFTMRVNEFLTYHLTLKEAKLLLNDLTNLINAVKK